MEFCIKRLIYWLVISLLGNRLSVAHLLDFLWRILEKDGCATETSPLNYISVAHWARCATEIFLKILNLEIKKNKEKSEKFKKIRKKQKMKYFGKT